MNKSVKFNQIKLQYRVNNQENFANTVQKVNVL